MAVHEIHHPLIRHKLGLLCRVDLNTRDFRDVTREIAALLTYEATRDLPLERIPSRCRHLHGQHRQPSRRECLHRARIG